MRRLYARWASLAPSERHLLLGMMVTLPAIVAMVRVMGVIRTQRLLERLSGNIGPRRVDHGDMNDAERLAELVAIGGRRGLISVTCLPQALLVQCVLRNRGLSPDLRLGIRREGDSIAAHAWVELQGVALGQGVSTHVPFARQGLGVPQPSRSVPPS